MKKLYLKQFKGDITNLKELKLDTEGILDIENSDEKMVLVIEKQILPDGTVEAAPAINSEESAGDNEVRETVFRIFKDLPKEQDEQGREKIVTVGGYIEYSKKPNKVSKIKKDDKKLMASLYGETPVLRELPKHHKVIGYVKLDGDTYLAIIQRKAPVVPILFFGLIAGMMCVYLAMPQNKVPISLDNFIQGPVDQGDIDISSDTVLQEAQNLRIIMNVSPVLENGTMNLLISNNKDSNTLAMVAEVMLLSKLDDKGNVIETYKKPIEIAETPILMPGDKIENVPVYEDAEIEPGRYDGRVMYTAYKITAEGAMPIGQVAGRISLVVK